MQSKFAISDLTGILASLLGEDPSRFTTDSSSVDFDRWDSVMQLEIIVKLDEALPGLIDACPELPSKGSVSELWAEIQKFLDLD